MAAGYPWFDGGQSYVEAHAGTRTSSTGMQDGGQQEGDLRPAATPEPQTQSFVEAGAYGAGAEAQKIPDGCLQRTDSVATPGRDEEICHGNQRSGRRDCKAEGTGRTLGKWCFQGRRREHGELRRCPGTAHLSGTLGSQRRCRNRRTHRSVAEGEAGCPHACTQNARKDAIDDEQHPHAGTNGSLGIIPSVAYERQEKAQDRAAGIGSARDCGFANGERSTEWRHGLTAILKRWGSAQENRHIGRRQQWPCLVTSVSGSLECLTQNATCKSSQNFDTARLATVVVIFYHLQFVATLLLMIVNAMYYAIKMISLLDSPTHQAFAVENLFWQMIRGVVAFITTFGILCLCRCKCKRRLCVIQRRRISRKHREHLITKRWKTGLFITLLLDCNLVNALSAHQEVERLQYGGGTKVEMDVNELAKDARYNQDDYCEVRLSDHGVHHNSYLHGSHEPQEEVRLDHERLPGDAIWLFRLGDALQIGGDIECIDEGRVLYVRTWYVDHRDDQHYESGVVRLTEQDSYRDWYANIMETWSDTIPRWVRIDVTLVEPKPPRIRFDEATTEHILLTTFREEAQPARRIAGIVSVVIGGEVRRQCTVLHHEGASTREILDVSGATWLNAGITYRVDGVPINDDPNVPWYGRSWTYFATLPEEQSDFVALGQVSIRTQPGKQCRPNPELTILPDDDIPHDLYYRSDNMRVQGRVIPPPNWRDHVTLASASYNGAVRRDEDNLPWVHLKTWILCYTRFCPRESRNLMIRAQLLVQLPSRVRQKWSDYIYQQDTVKLVIVKPTPAAAHGERQRLNIIAEVCKPPSLRTKPALFSFQQLSADGPEPLVLWVVASVGHSVTLQQVAQLHGGIEPAQMLVPLGTQDRRWMSEEDRRVLAPGHYVPVWWRNTPITPARPSQTTQGDEQSLFQYTVVASRRNTEDKDLADLHSESFVASVDSYSASLAVTDWMITVALTAEDPNLLRNDRGNCLLLEQSKLAGGDSACDDDDETIFMQRTSATTTARRSIRLIGLHRLTGLVAVDPDRTLEEQLQEVWPFQFTAYDQVNQIFRVPEPLTYATSGSEQVYILQLQDDHFEQVHDDDVLTLLSIRYTNPNSISDNKLRVRVVWAPTRTTRAALLQWLRLHWYCDRATVLCHIFVNSELWGEGDMTVRYLQPGDHCRIQIISAAEDLCDIEHSERLARRQRLIMSSDDEGGALDQAHEDDAATSASGSRASRQMRSRSRSRGDGLALLQVHANKVGTTQWENNGMITGYRNGTEDPKVLAPRHGVEEMITGFSRLQTDSEEPHHNRVFIDRFQRLSPPGNGVQSCSDLNSIDDWLWEGGIAVAVDYQVPDDPLDARSAPSPPVEDSGNGHIEVQSEESDMRLPVDQTLWLTYVQLIDGDAAFDVEIPSLEWQPSTAALLPQWKQPQLAPHEEFFIYTDGSAGCYHEGTTVIPKAHWAFAVWTTFKGKRSLMHHARGHVSTDRQDGHWHGADKATSLEAERAALIAATIWANRVLVAYRMPISFCFDNVAAGFGSSGQWHIQRCQSDAVLLPLYDANSGGAEWATAELHSRQGT